MAAPSSGSIKLGLLLAAVSFVIGVLLYAQSIVHKLQDRERTMAELLASAIANTASAPLGGDYTFLLEHIFTAVDFPLIISDAHNVPGTPYPKQIRNIALDSTMTTEQQKAFLMDKIAAYDAKHTPFPITWTDSASHTTMVLNYIHYGDSQLITQLQFLPSVEIAIGALFILVGYIGFSYIKRSEQSSIWAGMARETAHQLGTPLSSILGWTELLADTLADNPDGMDTVQELRNDLDRLEKIAARFNKIGSKPELTLSSVNAEVHRVVRYIERRIPTMNKSVAITLREQCDAHVALNAELFDWVLENLLKNALDAIESKGSIEITIGEKDGSVFIDVSDTGKGIEQRRRKDVFRPGYSTKRRGWGLGLSLSKRIVEDYHKGKIFVKSSTPGKGTTFRIQLTNSYKNGFGVFKTMLRYQK